MESTEEHWNTGTLAPDISENHLILSWYFHESINNFLCLLKPYNVVCNVLFQSVADVQSTLASLITELLGFQIYGIEKKNYLRLPARKGGFTIMLPILHPSWWWILCTRNPTAASPGEQCVSAALCAERWPPPRGMLLHVAPCCLHILCVYLKEHILSVFSLRENTGNIFLSSSPYDKTKHYGKYKSRFWVKRCVGLAKNVKGSQI